MSIEHEHLYLVDERKPEGNRSFSQRLFFNTPHIVSAEGLKLIPDYFFFFISSVLQQNNEETTGQKSEFPQAGGLHDRADDR